MWRRGMQGPSLGVDSGRDIFWLALLVVLICSTINIWEYYFPDKNEQSKVESQEKQSQTQDNGAGHPSLPEIAP